MITAHEGSSLHYSLLWIEPDARARFIARLNLVQALNSTLDDVQEPQVAEQKIHWWHEELQRMSEGEARHPATQACQQSLMLSSGTSSDKSTSPQPSKPSQQDTANQVLTVCLAILSSVSSDRFTPAATDKEADEQMVQNYAAQLALLSHALSNDVNDLSLDTHTTAATLGFAKYEQLTRLPYLLHRGHPVFSNETYQRHGIRPVDLATQVRVTQAEPTDESSSTSSLGNIPVTVEVPGRKTLMTSAIADLATALHAALSDEQTLQRYRQAPLLPLWRLLVLREKQAAVWLKHQPDLLRERTSLTPLVKFFTAWRHRR